MNPTRSLLQSGAVLVALVVVTAGSAARADGTDAREILQSMSDYLAGEASFAFDYDATLEIVTTGDQKLGVASSGNVAIARPDRIRATRTGGFADVEMVFDGETFSVIGKNADLYARMPIKGSIDHLVDELRESYGRPLPAADLLAAIPYDVLMSEVTDVKDLGAGVIRGEVCDHLAFRTPEVDWQLWVATGDNPYPCRYVITTHTISQGPQYQVDIRAWHGDAPVSDDTFAFSPPDGAKEVKFNEIRESIGELPGHFELGDAK
jgi:hypothetical protein